MNKKISIILGILIILISFPLCVYADTEGENEFSNLTMDIIINKDATATITETWEVSIHDGTEMYKPYYMSESEIEEFSVIDENGTEYEYLSDWDIDASQDDKTGKCGLYEENGAIELCWGIGEYGTHTYTLTYKITNFVSYYSSEEMQKTEITLVPRNMDPLPQNVQITISASFDFSSENITVTGNGFTGSTTIEDGKIKISTSSAIGSSQYIDLLVEYEDEPFSVSNTISSDYDYNQYEEIYTNSIDNEEEEVSFWQKYKNVIIIIIVVIIVVVAIIFINKNRNINNNNSNNNNNGNDNYIEV